MEMRRRSALRAPYERLGILGQIEYRRRVWDRTREERLPLGVILHES